MLNYFRTLASLVTILLVTGCASSSPTGGGVSSGGAAEEITLNMPQQNCLCESSSDEEAFLEKGFDSLHEGQFLEALQYFQRYQRLEKTDRADLQAKIAIAYLSIIPDSPIYDSEAARDSYRQLRTQVSQQEPLYGKIQLVQDSLETFLEMESNISDLKQENARLRKELAKREQAIKRLRDLTLGVEPAPAESP
jgi:hypothetical protein